MQQWFHVKNRASALHTAKKKVFGLGNAEFSVPWTDFQLLQKNIPVGSVVSEVLRDWLQIRPIEICMSANLSPG